MNEILDFSAGSIGQSGARLTLFRDSVSGGKILRKASLPSEDPQGRANSSSHSGSRDRIVKQAELQIEASKSNAFTLFRIPEVLKINREAGFFDMEFIDSVPLGEALCYLQNNDLDGVAKTLRNYLFEQDDLVILSAEEIAQVRSKVNGVLRSHPELAFEMSVNSLSELLVKAMSGLQFCKSNHGDFSLDNLLWEPRSKNLALVDFLDGPFSSRLADAGRLYLDLRFGWWLTPSEPSASKSSRHYLLQEIFGPRETLNAIESGVEIARALRAAAFFSALRVQPYSRHPRRLGLNLFAARTLIRELKETE